MRRDYARISGWIGLGLLMAVGISYAVRGISDAFFWAPLAIGLGLAGWWLVEFKTEAISVLKERRMRHGANSMVLTLAVATILMLLQALIVAHDSNFDLTATKEHTLSDELSKAVRNLDQKVEVKAFFGPEGREAYDEMLTRAKLLNPAKFSYEFVNPNKEVMLAKDLGVRIMGTSVVMAGDKRESFTTIKEEDLLNAILKVSSGAKKTVYVLAGHQEASLIDAQQFGLSAMKTSLENATFQTHELNFLNGAQGKVDLPEDAAALIIAGPKLDLAGPELEALTRYLGRGGRLFISLDPRQRVPGLQAWLLKAGVVLGDNIVVELNQMNQLMGLGPESALVQNFDRMHLITLDLAHQGGAAVFTLARTVSLGKLPEGASGTVLAKSLPTAYGWRGTGNRPPNKPGPADLKGPLDMMVALEAPVKDFGGAAPDGKARIVVVGNSAAVGNIWMSNPSFANQALFLNSVRWLANEEKRIALPPKPKENQPMMLDSSRVSLIRWSILLMLVGTLAAGILVTRARKKALA
jgi:ABC-type uncharacterized transport system involved in gliding motility auxiliary subunit